MATPSEIQSEINGHILGLVEAGLADDQSFAFIRRTSGSVQVTFANENHVTIALRKMPYKAIYRTLRANNAFNVRMLDGALLQMMYEFSGRALRRHRLAFFPAPQLHRFQDIPEVYWHDEVEADVVKDNVVPFPIRYDYDDDGVTPPRNNHPRSHLTLGQYEGCRIPVSAPVAPHVFVDFVLRNFYDTEQRKYAEAMPQGGCRFDQTIVPDEEKLVHVVVPA